jgi:hypothetical protein
VAKVKKTGALKHYLVALQMMNEEDSIAEVHDQSEGFLCW